VDERETEREGNLGKGSRELSTGEGQSTGPGGWCSKFVPCQTVSCSGTPCFSVVSCRVFIIIFFVSYRVVPKNDRRRHGTDKARRVWRVVP
jgi:hypothetical protein